MKTVVAALVCAVAVASAADINVRGAPVIPMGLSDLSVKIGSHGVLNDATSLTNKNTLSIGNNVFVTKSNIAFTQNDQLEQAILADVLQGVIMLTNVKDVLRERSAIVNQNVATTDTQTTIASSTIAPQTVASVVMPASTRQRHRKLRMRLSRRIRLR